MRVLILFILSFCFLAIAQEVAPVVAPAVVAATPETPAVVPPEWLLQALAIVKSLPIVGPYVNIGLQWLGVFASITTAFCAFLWGAIRMASTVVKFAGFAEIAAKILGWENSVVMQWLKYFSLFNAQKK